MVRDRGFLASSALVFVASAAGTIYWSRTMSGGGMPMPGGWTLSMAWMRAPGQSWFAAGATFMAMWVVMMVAMMLPSLVPVLSSHRRALCERRETGLAGLTTLAGAAYFFVWAVYGAAAYALGGGLTAAEMQWPAVARYMPLATGVVLLLAGAVQLTAWKARQLGGCWDALRCGGPEILEAGRAWRQGLRLGVRCALCCSGFMVVLLVTGMMNLGGIALVAAAITLERLTPRPERVARALGVVVMAAGALLIARALAAA
ncbi:MAG TPA: DUF2182 domain-containing protein [Gemmatimonadales bacterium]|nr:DUF2182 domain-containing protein [Gemmatimonadales bacterium]